MTFRSETYRVYTQRPERTDLDQLAWDWFTAQHNAEPLQMYYRRTDGYTATYTAEIEVLGPVIQKFRIPRRDVPRDLQPVRVRGRRCTKVRIYDETPSHPDLRGLWHWVARLHGPPASLRVEFTARGPTRATVTLENRREFRFRQDAATKAWICGV